MSSARLDSFADSIRVQQLMLRSLKERGPNHPCRISNGRGGWKLGTLGELYDLHATHLAVLWELEATCE